MTTRMASRLSVGQSVRVIDPAPDDYRGRTGIVTEIGPGDPEYRVEFEDGLTPTTGYFRLSWLEPTGR